MAKPSDHPVQGKIPSPAQARNADDQSCKLEPCHCCLDLADIPFRPVEPVGCADFAHSTPLTCMALLTGCMATRLAVLKRRGWEPGDLDKRVCCEGML